MTDRERILMNIAAGLARELNHFHRLPLLEEYMKSHQSLVQTEWGCFQRPQFHKGDLVVCFTSAWRQQHEFIVSFVEAVGIPGDREGLVLRAIGSDRLCNYGNESFLRIVGIPESLLWEGEQYQFSVKVHKALRKLSDYVHRFRGLEFSKESGRATLFIGQVFGGAIQRTKPYLISLTFNRKTSIRGIIVQMKEQGFGTRKFDPDDGTYAGPMEGVSVFTRDSLMQTLNADGFKLKSEPGGSR